MDFNDQENVRITVIINFAIKFIKIHYSLNNSKIRAYIYCNLEKYLNNYKYFSYIIITKKINGYQKKNTFFS